MLSKKYFHHAIVQHLLDIYEKLQGIISVWYVFISFDSEMCCRSGRGECGILEYKIFDSHRYAGIN